METNADTPHILRQRRDELYKAAREHPGSAEDEIVEILLLSAMANLEPAPYDAMPGLALGEERQRFHAADPRRAREHRQRQKAQSRGRGRRAAAPAGESMAELRRELKQRQQRLEKIEEALEGARAAMAAGKQMTDMEIYNRIAAVIGLIPPSGSPGPGDPVER
jgi:hypothetical protein